jgi:hypothetical protein
MLALEKGTDLSVLVRFLLTELVAGRIKIPENIGAASGQRPSSLPVEAA